MVLGDAVQRIADEADVPGLEIGEAVEIIVNLTGARVGGKGIDGEVAPRGVLFQSSVYATVARRPSVETSRRRVVISTGWPSLTAVIVP
jgi:hypothetical protein